MNEARRNAVIALGLGGLLAIKMVAFEPLRPSLFGMRVELVAILLPLALPLGWRGVVALGIGCGLAHTFHGTGIYEGLAAGMAVAGSLMIVHLGLRQPWDVQGILARCLALAALLAVALGFAFAIVRPQPLPIAIAGTFANVVLPVALGGPPALLVALRISKSPGNPAGARSTP